MKHMIAALLALCLSACNDRFPDYRYKMTIELATADGVKSFSSVRQVRQDQTSSVLSSDGTVLDTEVTGEAVVLDLPSGPVFALLSRPESADYAKYIAAAALKRDMPDGIRGATNDRMSELAKESQYMVSVQGPRELPRTRPSPDPVRDPEPVQLWPFFVRFGDLGDPTSVREVSPESIGVRRITIEITDEPVTDGIGELLPWVFTKRGELLDGSSTMRANGGLANAIGTGDFRAGFN